MAEATLFNYAIYVNLHEITRTNERSRSPDGEAS